MTITPQQKEHLVALTTVMFNAPPGARYLKELAGNIEAGTSLEQLAVNLAATEAFKSQFSGLPSQDARIDKVLDNLGLTSGTSAYQEAYTFFDARLDAGADLGRLLLEAGKYLYTSDDPTFSDATALYRNKIDAGVYHSVTLGLESSSVEALQDAIAGVTQAPESVSRVKERLDSVAESAGAAGNMTAIEVYPINMHLGTAGNDTLHIGSDATAIGLDGDDTLISQGWGMTGLLGGEGNDTYVTEGTVSEITDSGGDDTLKLSGLADDYTGGFVNGQHLLLYNARTGHTTLTMDFKGAGRIETIADASGQQFSADTVENYVYQQGQGDIAFSDLQYASGYYDLNEQTFNAALEMDMVFGQLDWHNVFQRLSEHGTYDGPGIADAIQSEAFLLLSPAAQQLWQESNMYQALANSTYHTSNLSTLHQPMPSSDSSEQSDYLQNSSDLTRVMPEKSGVPAETAPAIDLVGIQEPTSLASMETLG